MSAAGFFIAGPTQFYRSYLWAYMFIIGISVGSLAWLMLQYVTGGAWGLVIRRSCEAATRTLPLVLVMFLPIVIGINNLYPWAHAAAVKADPLLQHKAPYLNVPFFLGRAAFYFAGWMFLAWWFNRWSLKEDLEGHDVVHGKMSAHGRPGLSVLGIQRHLHVHRLDSFGGPQVVLHDFRHALHGQPGFDGDGLSGHADGAAVPAAGRCRKC